MATTSGDESGTLLAHALACAAAGYPVFRCWPQSKAPRAMSPTKATTDGSQVRRWWMRMSDSNVGVWLNDVPMVVLDIDGPQGEVSLLRLLDQADLGSLPSTFEVLTGREGGRHLWFRLPVGAVKLVNQLGGDGPSPGLDVLFQGNAIGPGSIHKSGRVYTAVGGAIWPLSDLTDLPSPLYNLLKARGRERTPEKAPSSPVERPTSQNVPCGVPGDVVVPQATQMLLDDDSDHRDQRTLTAVTQLVEQGLTDDEISAVVLSSRLGSKALEERDPQRWLDRKIARARKYEAREWNRQSYWWAVHTSGMSPAAVKVADFLWCKASRTTGVVTVSERQVEVGAGVANSRRVLKQLLRGLWLVEVRPGSKTRATRYRLVDASTKGSGPTGGILVPSSTPQGASKASKDTPSKSKATKGVRGFTLPPNPPTCWGLSTTFSVDLVGHDAFRSKQGSLATAYPLLTLLGPEPQPQEQLRDWLHLSQRQLQDRLDALTKAEIITVTDGLVALVTTDLLPLLDAAAKSAATKGKRAAAEHRNAENDFDFRLGKRQAAEVGSPKWTSWKMSLARSHIEDWQRVGTLPLDCDVEDLAEKLVAWELSGLQGEARARSTARILDHLLHRLARI